MIEGVFVEGLIYGIMVLGVFITFRILDFPDLTVDGSFPLGAAVMASLLTKGVPIPAALLISFGSGILAGFCTALIHNKLKVPNLLAGILTMTMLYSVNIRILGNRANVQLLRHTTLFSWTADLTQGVIPSGWAFLILMTLIAMLIKVLIDLFFHTDLGLTFGALGNNEQMIVSQGVNPETLKLLGLGLSNGLVALSGAMAAQYQGFADVNLGQGIVVSGLASVMIGEFLISSNKIEWITLRALIGAVLFRAIMYAGRMYGYRIGLTPNDLKLITGLLIILSLVLSKRKTGALSLKKLIPSRSRI